MEPLFGAASYDEMGVVDGEESDLEDAQTPNQPQMASSILHNCPLPLFQGNSV